jgi:queuine tRNA-ribosyltransferase
MAFTDAGPLRLRNKIHERDERPLEAGCPCLACRHSRAYLRHLFMADEMLGPILLTHHNLTYYQRLVAGAREAIEADRFTTYCDSRLSAWSNMEAIKGNEPRINTDQHGFEAV